MNGVTARMTTKSTFIWAHRVYAEALRSMGPLHIRVELGVNVPISGFPGSRQAAGSARLGVHRRRGAPPPRKTAKASMLSRRRAVVKGARLGTV